MWLYQTRPGVTTIKTMLFMQNVLKDSISAPSRQHRPSGSAAKTKQIKSG